MFTNHLKSMREIFLKNDFSVCRQEREEGREREKKRNLKMIKKRETKIIKVGASI